ncbi:MAG: serine/threonine-protein phosphatase [Candidatus Nitronauta litoralis]|uniref:Serine/threonine-protein phosphatase n=1 Tax=Candidatus Nitronauta litoralis TaxID=2705533 RepID=A0A7T0BWU9_9BACT|nr:MAG: serine/threonine-protein phosphatase [Candidatus Nitronauta litoralis]
MIEINCSEIWGGINSTNNDVTTRRVNASLYSRAHDNDSGGDIYYFSVCGKDLITRIAIADVAGHGSSVSEISSWLYEALSDNMNQAEGQKVLNKMNQTALEEGIKGITTASVFTVNAMSSKLSFSNAGHFPFLYKKCNETFWKPISFTNPKTKGNIPLGTLPGTHFDEESLEIRSGDRFFIYTDGLFEASNKEKESFGSIQLLETLNDGPDLELSELKESMVQALETHRGEMPVQDDLTFMVVEFANEGS